MTSVAGEADHPEVLWSPDERSYRGSALAGFVDWLAQQREIDVDSYQQLYDYSVADLAGFWSAVAEYFEVMFRSPHEQVLTSEQMPGAGWFPGATLNYAEHALRSGPGKGANDVAVIALTEAGERQQLSYGELRTLVAAAQAGLRTLGVAAGDRVVALAPNCAQTLVGFLATASIGAVWSSCSPEFGAQAVCDRFSQLEPSVLIAVDGYRYGGRLIDIRPTVDALRQQLPTLRATVLVGYLDAEATLPGTTSWSQLMESESGSGTSPVFAAVPFEHPLWVLYSSGTTGLPKGIVHGHGGMLLEHLKALALQADLGPGQRFFWYTTTGWMMWNFLIAGLLVGCTVVLYDGSPVHPTADALWRLVESERVSYFGTSAAYLQSCDKHGLRPLDHCDLSQLRAVGSTGSPLSPQTSDWITQSVGTRVQICSISGGTDVCTAFLSTAPNVPVWRGEISCRALGAAAAAFDENGTGVTSVVGELVLTKPMPCMPVGLWGDADGNRLIATYFDRYPGVWCHGDWVQITPRGSCVLYGRSDATLNRDGVRMGTAEFYRVIEACDQVLDSLVVETGVVAGSAEAGEVLCCVVLAPGASMAAVEAQLRARLRSQLSPRHVPDRFLEISEVPVTLNGKKCEIPVRRILAGTPIEQAVSVAALRNPGALKQLCERVRQPVLGGATGAS